MILKYLYIALYTLQTTQPRKVSIVIMSIGRFSKELNNLHFYFILQHQPFTLYWQ